MLVVALFMIAKFWTQSRCPTTDEWIKKMWFIYTMEHHSVIKKNEIMLFACKCMELQNIILIKVSQTEKVKAHMRSLICEATLVR
jgi:hypothetical protein